MANTNLSIAFVSFFLFCCGYIGHVFAHYQEDASKEGTDLINEEELKRMTQFAVEWCHNNGLILALREGRGRGDVAGFPPITLFPSPFPRSAFEQALNAQKAMNLLYFRVARDFDFLMDAYKDVVKSDEFIAKLVTIAKEVHEEGIRQPITVMLQRADYLLNVVEDEQTNKVKYEPKQVEVNTGAIGATALKRRTTELHRRMLQKMGMDASISRTPENNPDKAMVETLYKAWRLFKDPKAILLLLVASDTPFNYDVQYMVEQLHTISDGTLKVVTYSLGDYWERKNSTKRLQLDPEDFSLRLDGQRVAVVYSGQSLLGCQFDDLGMEFRQLIERSTAIKAPSLFIGLTGSKKVQQLLAKPGVLERFFPEPEHAGTVGELRATFAGLWGLENDDEKTRGLIQDAIAHPANYVLKPNRECGGNNFYDEKLVEKLRQFTPSERGAHILMQKLRPMVVKNYVVRTRQEAKAADVIPELGVYGFLIGNLKDGRVRRNVQQGYHFRTKLSHVNEAGISAGFGFYDSAYLF